MSLISAMIKTYKGDRLSKEKIKKIQYKRLKKLVEYAKNNSPYFKDLYADVSDDFSLEVDYLAFSPRCEFGEIDYNDNNPDLDEMLVNALAQTENLFEINIDFDF